MLPPHVAFGEECMRIAVVGLGYVGLVTASCLARLGQTVVGIERDERRLETLRNGDVPYYEPHLAPDLKAGLASGALTFTGDAAEGLRDADVVMICVGTPSDAEGRANLTDVLDVAHSIAEHVGGEPVIALRSTVPVGTTRRIEAEVNADRERRSLPPIRVFANPEFLRTGRAIEDWLRPTRVVIGTTGKAPPESIDRLMQLYGPLDAPILVTDAESAELVKNASNAFLATRISFVNELAALCEATGATIDSVVEGMAYDPRIGGQFMKPGLGFGGSCLPKEVRSMLAMGRDHELAMPLMTAVNDVNVGQVDAVADRLAELLDRPLAGARIAILGLAFKPDTDDIRESPPIALARELVDRGASVVACDPKAAERAAAVLPSLQIARDAAAAAAGADAIVLGTEWPEYATANLRSIAAAMRGDVLFDARNALDPDAADAAGLRYAGIGRAAGQGQERVGA
jgi:UDPglucose 6-dehydrogenase